MQATSRPASDGVHTKRKLAEVSSCRYWLGRRAMQPHSLSLVSSHPSSRPLERPSARRSPLVRLTGSVLEKFILSLWGLRWVDIRQEEGTDLRENVTGIFALLEPRSGRFSKVAADNQTCPYHGPYSVFDPYLTASVPP